MPVYLIVAYVIFCLVPGGMGLAIYVRSRRVVRDIEALEGALDQSTARMEPR